MADLRNIDAHSPEMLTAKVGEKLEQFRLSKNITQSQLARDSGVSERTLRRLESGEGATLDSFIRVIIALNLDSNLDLLVPNPRVRPIERIRTGGSERQRSRAGKTEKSGEKWQWGEEET